MVSSRYRARASLDLVRAAMHWPGRAVWQEGGRPVAWFVVPSYRGVFVACVDTRVGNGGGKVSGRHRSSRNMAHRMS